MLALTQEAFAQAVVAIEAAHSGAPSAQSAGLTQNLTQQHELIRQANEYADLFAHASAATVMHPQPGAQA